MCCEWRDISTAPKDGTHILAVAYKNGVKVGTWTLIAWNIWEDRWGDHPGPASLLPIKPVIIQPTHWIPIPPAPPADAPQEKV